MSELNSLGGLRLDASAVGLGLGASNKLNSSGRLGLDVPAVGLGLGASRELNSLGGLGLNALAVGLGLGASSGSLGNLEGNTGRYDLQKRPRALTHRIWVEEEPMDSADPVSYWEAIMHPRFGQKWSDAVDEELRSLAENSTWDYVGLEDVPAGVTPISSKWVFKTKELPGGGIRYKARLVIRGFEQQAGVDFDETFTPVAKLQSLHMMLALTASTTGKSNKWMLSPPS